MNDANDSLLEKCRRFRKRPPEDRALILRSMLFLSLTGIGLRIFGFHRWRELIEQFSLAGRLTYTLPVTTKNEIAQRAVRAIRSVELHGPGSPNCLERSMALWWLLRRNGIEGELHIGARKNGALLEAHAWVELGGQVLNDSAGVRDDYALFDAPIAAAEVDSHVASKTESH